MPEHTDLSHAVWRASTKSGANGDCVEVAVLGDAIAVRDSKDRGGPVLTFDRVAWRALLGEIKASAGS